MKYQYGQRPRKHPVRRAINILLATIVVLILTDLIFNYGKLTIDLIYELISLSGRIS